MSKVIGKPLAVEPSSPPSGAGFTAHLTKPIDIRQAGGDDTAALAGEIR